MLLRGLDVDADELDHLRRLTVLPHCSQFTDLLLLPGERLSINIKDVECCYYNLVWPLPRLLENAVGPPIRTQQLLRRGATFRRDLLEALPPVPFFRPPGMGDQKAAEVTQCWQSHMLVEGGSFTSDSWMSYGFPPPRSSLWERVYLDDQLSLGIFRRNGDRAWQSTEEASDRVDRTYATNEVQSLQGP